MNTLEKQLKEKDKLNQKLRTYLIFQCGLAQVEHKCKFENGEWDYETMGRIILTEFIIPNETYRLKSEDQFFVDRILSFYPDCITDKYLVKRGVY